MGLTFIRSCTGKPYTPERLAEHAKHVIRVGGTALPALGTDFLGMSGALDGLNDISEVGKFGRALVRAGLSAKQAEAILNDNALNYIRKRSERW